MTLINAAGSNDKQRFADALSSALSDFYLRDPSNNLGKLYQALAEVLVTADKEVSALRHDNFLSVTVENEMKTRDVSFTDRLLQEGAFAVDRVGFTPSGFIRQEIHRVETSNTVIVLENVPFDFETVAILSDTSKNAIPVSFVLDFDENANSITVAGVDNPGDYIFEYVDNGNTAVAKERLAVPTELFKIGFGQGGFGNFGFGL